jgi:hypothetical protein
MDCVDPVLSARPEGIGLLFELAPHNRPNAERRTPNAERRTPNAERRTPNAERYSLSRRRIDAVVD